MISSTETETDRPPYLGGGPMLMHVNIFIVVGFTTVPMISTKAVVLSSDFLSEGERHIQKKKGGKANVPVRVVPLLTRRHHIVFHLPSYLHHENPPSPVHRPTPSMSGCATRSATVTTAHSPCVTYPSESTCPQTRSHSSCHSLVQQDVSKHRKRSAGCRVEWEPSKDVKRKRMPTRKQDATKLEAPTAKWIHTERNPSSQRDHEEHDTTHAPDEEDAELWSHFDEWDWDTVLLTLTCTTPTWCVLHL